MKITLQQLPLHLKNNKLAPAYLITGDEYFLVREALEAIVTSAQNQGYSDLQRLYVEANFDWNKFYSETSNLSLFSEHKIIELFLSATINDTGNKIISKYMEHPNKNNLLVIVADKLDASSQRKSWVKALEQHGVVIQIWPIENAQLPAWVIRRANQTNLKIDPQGAALIADYCNGNLFAAAQEIEKLSLIFGTNIITPNELSQAISDNSRYNVFNLVDQTLLGQGKQIATILAKLENDGTEPTLVLWALTRELRTIIRIARAVQNGHNLEQAITAENIWGNRKIAVKHILAKPRLAAWEKLLQDCYQLDLYIKGALPGNIWREFTRTYLALGNINVV